MNKHIKAEFYRISRGTIFFRMFVFMALALAVLGYVIQEDFTSNTLDLTLMGCSELFMFVPMVLVTLASVIVSRNYFNRTYYYEIMDGTNTHTIIMSKLAVYGSMAFIYIVPVVTIAVVIGARNGLGTFEKPLLHAAAFIVITLHLFLRATLISMLIRHIVGGALVSYMLTCVEFVFIMVNGLISGNDIEDSLESTGSVLNNWLPTSQCSMVMMPKLDSGLIIGIFGSFAAMLAVFYTAVYFSHKNKKFA